MTTDERVREIRLYPDRHRHETFDELQVCAVENGVLSLEVFDAHVRFAPQGAGKHDVKIGPCACGVTHKRGEIA